METTREENLLYELGTELAEARSGVYINGAALNARRIGQLLRQLTGGNLVFDDPRPWDTWDGLLYDLANEVAALRDGLYDKPPDRATALKRIEQMVKALWEVRDVHP